MSILQVKKKENCNEKPCVNELEYGTFVTDVPSGNDNIYVKVKKKRKTEGFNRTKRQLSMEWQPGYCVLCNLKYGTLRQIPGETQVTPLKPCLTVAPLPENRYKDVKRECYK